MKRGIQKVLVVWLLSIALFTESFCSTERINADAAEKQKTEGEETSWREGEAIVVLKNTKSSDAQTEEATRASMQESGMTVEELLTFDADTETENATGTGKNTVENKKNDLKIGVVKSDTLTTEEMLQKLSKNKQVELAEPNYIQHISALTNDQMAPYQWSLENTGQNGGRIGAALHPDYIWNGGETGTENVIAVVDSGMDASHPDLINAVWENTYQGVLPGEHGYDFVNQDEDPQDDNGHGTHCSGIIAAEGNNEIGITGVNQHAKIMALKVLNAAGYGEQSDIISAYHYIYRALQLGVRVVAVNNSWEGTYGEILTRVINKVGEAGAISVFAAGNRGADLDKSTGEDVSEQSKLNNPYTIIVAATNEKDELAQFSNYGKKTITLAAPGTDIISTSIEKRMLTPAIMTSQEREKKCALYQSYDQIELPVYERQEDGSVKAKGEVPKGMPQSVEVRRNGKERNTNAEISICLDTDTFFGEKGGKALKISVKGVQKGDMLYATIPYDAAPEQKTEPMISVMAQVSKDTGTSNEVSNFAVNDCEADEVENLKKLHSMGYYMVNTIEIQKAGTGMYWEQICGLSGEQNMSKQPQKREIVLQANCSEDGTYQIILDELAVSNGMEEESEKYEYMSGTSMAAPHVTGAVALMAAAYKERSPLELINMMKSSVRKTPELEEKTISGGVLDLSKLSTPEPFISSAVYEKDRKLHLKGYGFLKEQTSVTIDGEEMAAEVLSDTELMVDGKNFRNSCVNISVTTTYGASSASFYLIKGKKEYKKRGSLGGYSYYGEALNRTKALKDNQFVTDGIHTFLYEADGGAISEIGISGKSESLDEESDNYASILYRFDLTEIPTKDGLQESEDMCRAVSNMVYLNRQLFFLMSRQKMDDVSKEVALVSYDIDSRTGNFIGYLPERYQNRTAVTLGVCSGKLYLIGGYDYGEKQMSKETLRAEWNEKGKLEWKQATPLPEERADGICTQDGENLYYALGMTDKMNSCPQTLVFDGKKWKKLNGTPDALQSEIKMLGGKEYRLYRGNMDMVKEGILYSGFPCNGLGDTFLQDIQTGELTPTAYNCVEEVENEAFIGTVVGNTLIGLFANEYDTIVRTQEGWDSLVTITTNVKGSGEIIVTPWTCLPGEKVTIKAKAGNGAFLKKLSINGKKVQNKYTTLFTGETLNVKAEFGNYVKKIKINKKKSGKKWRLCAVIVPSDAHNKTITWNSSNKKYATISKSGIITVKKKGIGKRVTFTVTAKDRKKIKATYEMKLK